MDAEPDPRDAGLLAALGDALDAADPVPAPALLAARSAIAWRTLDAALLEITSDSLDPASAGAVRDAAASRLVSFRQGPLSVDVEVEHEGGSRVLNGQVTPAGPARLAVLSAAGEREVPLDADGRFRVSGLRPGPVSLHVEAAGGAWARPARTGWTAI